MKELIVWRRKQRITDRIIQTKKVYTYIRAAHSFVPVKLEQMLSVTH